MSDKCHFNDPNMEENFDACVYEVIEKYENVTIEVQKCKNCGHIEVVWYRQEDTKQVDPD